LLPKKRTQFSDDPAVELLKELFAESNAEIVEPSRNKPIQFNNDLLHINAPTAARDFTHLVFEPFKGFGMDAEPGFSHHLCDAKA